MRFFAGDGLVGSISFVFSADGEAVVKAKAGKDSSRPGYAEASEELGILERLAQSVWAAISEFSRRPNFDRDTGEVELAIHDSRQDQLRGYRELAHHAYGRTVMGNKIDEVRKTTEPFKFRITQANVSQLDCGIIARNAPVASQLVSAQVGDEREINREGTRYFKIEEARTFEGPTSLHLSSERPDFRQMTIFGKRKGAAVVVSGLRAFVEGISHARSLEDARPSVRPDGTPDAGWIVDWSSIDLGDSDNQSLSHQFFTQTTKSQEDALNKPTGLTLVEGIAGAGKTSVALGRLKFFSNFSTGENKEHYGLENAPARDFSPAAMVGFVLSRSLRRYLADTARELDLERLPIRDFQEYRIHLSNRFGLTRTFRRSEVSVPTCRTQLEWLRAVDAAIARSAAAKLSLISANTTDLAPTVKQAVQRFSFELRTAEPQTGSSTFYTSGLAQRLVQDVLRAEYRAREDSIHEQSRKREFRERFDLERELLQVRQEEERGALTPFVRQLLGALTVDTLFADAVNAPEFPGLVKAAFNDSSKEDVDQSIDEIRKLFAPRKDNDRRAVTDADLLVLIACAAMIADDFEYPNAPNHIYRVRQSTAVFIDEVQDFTEIEVCLMGLSASKQYHQITLSGDLCQRLQSSGSKTFMDLFPSVPRSNRNAPIFLNRNFRQRPPLARLSAGFRNLLQGDERLKFAASGDPILLHCYSSSDAIRAQLLERLSSIHEYATVAVILPTEGEAAKWHALLAPELGAGRRPASLSRREDLTGRFDIHFTHVYETKGLEFDVVIIPDLSAFDLLTEIGRNQAYVAISRPKHSLFLGCRFAARGNKEVVTLIDGALLRAVEIG
jgi:hypothetical protein